MKTAKEFLKDKNIPEKRDRQIIEKWLEQYHHQRLFAFIKIMRRLFD